MECGLTLYGGVRWRGGRGLLMPHLYVHLELVRHIQLLGDGHCISSALEGGR